ncbi:hypothetical protein GON01_05175 [Sphingomonas sp. MAH-20]|jgi:hypothetical protein|uniref:Uncharacterized protein n=1 Tax=Sphingomonas horti TaxID=2682842 RepID=A0A6I4IYP2_9SPHN|nr:MULTISPECIES: DUF5985 family protein [Sphingomonas]MBA2918362.1 hypothetical protein [Sphingomonas sp. CGMCC 1.13658]MVO77329.1 hypothetical protein [Sphingomonas horti]
MNFETWFPGAVYLLCFITSAICAWLLMRSYLKVRGNMLFWSALCFGLLALNNLIVIFDLMIVPVDLGLYRLAASLLAIAVLLFGFIWRGDEA